MLSLSLSYKSGQKKKSFPEEVGNDSFTENSPSLLGSFGEPRQLLMTSVLFPCVRLH